MCCVPCLIRPREWPNALVFLPVGYLLVREMPCAVSCACLRWPPCISAASQSGPLLMTWVSSAGFGFRRALAPAVRAHSLPVCISSCLAEVIARLLALCSRVVLVLLRLRQPCNMGSMGFCLVHLDRVASHCDAPLDLFVYC